ncbi:hypothetical protein [Pelagibacterium lentulum]|uniref:Uncharacterized protein n=1 Tax=Pelagibacterium lentulum TaxID=2029865 RepID=A0A916RPS5_9HYPH|nr:hypothetical protein [Pelagibacterium lentulum]GGA63771.1 hypothetical protein GCM10011499_37680 [Pelagibacterium lentulum]
MTDLPILFSAPMVRALLREIEAPGTGKTQTRRVITKARVFATPEQRAFILKGADLDRAMQNADCFRRIDGNGWFWEADAFEWQAPHTRTGWMARIGYAPGDRLYVREAIERANGEAVGFPADGSWLPNTPWEWQRPKLPAIHMPRRLSRITLLVTEVRVERLQEISEVDAIAEGGQEFPCEGPYRGPDATYWTHGAHEGRRVTARSSFLALWEEINGPDAWASNPWVAAYTFRPILGNIDQVAA